MVDKPPESPTTARELQFDDEPPTSPQPAKSTADSEKHNFPNATATTQGAPPPQPPRPLSPRQQAENTLKEAFPGIEAPVIRAVLTASGGQLEPAFNALLGWLRPSTQTKPMSDRPQKCPILAPHKNQFRLHSRLDQSNRLDRKGLAVVRKLSSRRTSSMRGSSRSITMVPPDITPTRGALHMGVTVRSLALRALRKMQV